MIHIDLPKHKAIVPYQDSPRIKQEVLNWLLEHIGNRYTALEYVKNSNDFRIKCWNAEFLDNDTVRFSFTGVSERILLEFKMRFG